MSKPQHHDWPLDRVEKTFQGVLLGSVPREDLLDAIAQPNPDGAKEDKADLLNIYASGYVSRLEEVMGENFEGLHTLMGDEEFAELCHTYLRQTPSRVRSVRWTGQYLEDFLRDETPWCDHPVLGDMAAFDWAVGETFDAPDSPDGRTAPMDDAALATIPPEDWPALRFIFQDALRTTSVTFDVHRFFQQMQGDGENLVAPVALGEATTILFWRDPDSLAVRYRALSDGEALVLSRARAGECFADICACLAGAVPAADTALEAARMVQIWLAHGLVTAIDTP